MTSFVIVAAVMGAYFAVLTVGAIATQPLRYRLARLADELATDGKRTDAELSELDWMVASSTSSVVGLLLPVAALFTTASLVLGAKIRPEPDVESLGRDPRFAKAIGWYFVSVAACSPFAALVATPIILIGVMAAAIRGGRSLMEAAEAPLMKASAAFQPC